MFDIVVPLICPIGAFLPGWRWARIMQLALAGSSSSLHSEVCKALKRASACFTTNFLDRELISRVFRNGSDEVALARLPPERCERELEGLAECLSHVDGAALFVAAQ